jgi:capsular polysaccharide transport system permease protein
VNRLNEKARENSISEAERRVRVAEGRAKAARLAVASYRNENQIFDPSKQATGVFDIANKLTGEKAMLQAQLDLMLAKTPQNPAIPALRSQISAIQDQISQQNERVVGSSGAFASKLSAYENLQLEQEFATQALSAANVALEQARTEADRQQYYLERIVEPTAPDVAAYPRRLRGILTVLFVSLCLYVIGWMFVVGILEHAPEE